MENCKYCSKWNGQRLELKKIRSNLNGVASGDESIMHEGFAVQIKDHAFTLVKQEDDPGYKEYVKQNPGHIEICSEQLGRVLSPNLPNINFVLEITINYCPYCGRELGVIPKEK